MTTTHECSLSLPSAERGIITRLRLRGVEPEQRGKYGPVTPFAWAPEEINDAHFPPTASRWGRRVVPEFVTCAESVLPEWGECTLRSAGLLPAEGGELMLFALTYPALVMSSRVLATGQYWRDPRAEPELELMVCAGPHTSGKPAIFLGLRDVPVPAGTRFLGFKK